MYFSLTSLETLKEKYNSIKEKIEQDQKQAAPSTNEELQKYIEENAQLKERLSKYVRFISVNCKYAYTFRKV